MFRVRAYREPDMVQHKGKTFAYLKNGMKQWNELGVLLIQRRH